MRFAYDKLRCVCMLTVLNILFLQVAAQASEGIRWAPDLKSAQQASAQFSVPVLVHFWGEDCLPCKTLDTRVFSKPELVDTLNKYFICVRVNAAEHKQLAANYGVHSWPTDVFLSPQGQVLYQGVCPQNAETYKGVVQNVAIMNRDNNALIASQQAAQQASPKTTMQQNYASQPSQQDTAGGAQASFSGRQAAPPMQQAGNPSPQQVAMQQGYVGQEASGGLPPRSNSSFTQTADGAAKLLPPPEEMGKYAQYDAQPVQYSQSPAESVISGPLNMQSQPKSIQTAMQPAVNTPMSTSHAGRANDEHYAERRSGLPPRSTVGMVPPANPMSAGTQLELSQVSSMPVMTTKEALQPKSNPVFKPASNVVVSSTGKTVANPYFQDTHSYAAPKEPTATGTQMAAQQQSVVRPSAPSRTAAPQFAENRSPAENVTNTSTNVGDSFAANAGALTQPAAEITPQPSTMVMTPSEPVQSVPTPAAPDSTVAMQADSTSVIPSARSTEFAPAAEDAFQPRQQQAGEESTQKGLSGEGVAFAQASNGVVGEIGLVEESPALEGYCPIALVTKADWIEGSKEFKVRHRGKWYWLSSEEAKKQFLKAPDQSSPLVSGHDPYILLEEGRLVEGSIQYGLHEQISGVFMLFSSAENKQKYWDDYDRYSKALEALMSRARSN